MDADVNAAEWFAGRLRELREAAGAVPEAAWRIGPASEARPASATWSKGIRRPSWETVVALCRALNVACDAFLQPPSPDLPPAAPGRPRKAPADVDDAGAGQASADAARGKVKGRKGGGK